MERGIVLCLSVLMTTERRGTYSCSSRATYTRLFALNVMLTHQHDLLPRDAVIGRHPIIRSSPIFTATTQSLYVTDQQCAKTNGVASAFCAFLFRCQRLGYCRGDTPTITEMFEEADDKLFSRVLANDHHVLQQYLSDRTSTQYNVRTRASPVTHWPFSVAGRLSPPDRAPGLRHLPTLQRR